MHIYIYTYIHIYIYTYMHIYLYTYIHIHIYTYILIYLYAYIHMHNIYLHTYIHKYIHTYIQTYIHTYICIIYIYIYLFIYFVFYYIKYVYMLQRLTLRFFRFNSCLGLGWEAALALAFQEDGWILMIFWWRWCGIYWWILMNFMVVYDLSMKHDVIVHGIQNCDSIRYKQDIVAIYGMKLPCRTIYRTGK